MIDNRPENAHSPEFRALTIVTAALAETLAKAGMLDTFIVRLQMVAGEASDSAPPNDPAMAWVQNVTCQLLKASSAT